MSENPIEKMILGRTRSVQKVENTAVVAGVSVPVGAGFLLWAGLLSPLDAGITAGTALTVAVLTKLVARKYRHGAEHAANEWFTNSPVRPGRSD
ncbi:MAG: hypothetical protein V4449_02870 [Patescibacteria group bacterium]